MDPRPGLTPPGREEVPLTGGNSSTVVRIGDRVHRTAGPWSPTVHAWLTHLRRAGVDLVPEPFGFDGQGREVLSFLPGHVPAYPLPEEVWSDRFLVDAARVLRRLHDAGADFPRGGALWQQPSREPDEVVSINDFAPYNLVVADGRITGVIDLDQASPGPRVRDVAHLAYRLVPLTRPQNVDGRVFTAADRARRLGMLVQAYDGPSAEEVLRVVPPLLADVAAHADCAGRPDHGDGYRADRAWLLNDAEDARIDGSASG